MLPMSASFEARAWWRANAGTEQVKALREQQCLLMHGKRVAMPRLEHNSNAGEAHRAEPAPSPVDHQRYRGSQQR
jgi:hypothetical protein